MTQSPAAPPLAKAAEEKPDHFTVTGAVTSPGRDVIGVLRVEIVGKQAGPDVPLADVKTDARGRYAVDFPASKLPAEMAKPDLQARISSGETFLAASEILYEATSPAVLDVSVPANTQGLPSEFESLLGAIGEHYKGKLRDLEESGERQDVTYLANKCGCEVRSVAMAAAADELAAESPIHPAFYYALLRARVPAEPDALYQTDLETVTGIWRTAIDQGVILQSLGGKLAEAEKAFQKLAVKRVLDNRPVEGTSSLKELVELTLPDEKQQQKLAELYARYRKDPAKLFDEVRSAFGGEVAERLRLDSELAALTLNNAPLIKALRGKVSTPEDLASGGFYNAEAWKDLVAKSPLPSQIPGNSEQERRANYAETLAEKVRQSFPTAVIAEKVRKNEIKVPPKAAKKAAERAAQGVARSVAPAMATDPAEEARLQQMRVSRITQDVQAMGVLLTNGLDSAYDIVAFEEEEFVRRFKDPLGGEAKARQIYAQAKRVHNTVLNVAVSYMVARNAPGLGMTPEGSVLLPAEEPPQVSNILAYPTLEGIFGSMDYCACEHCRSVLSPAAYLVDLLQFLDHPEEKEKNPQQILLGRRPDLQHLPLTCDNTNLLVPYIDLVNETLEYFVTHNLSLAAYKGYGTPGNVSPEELLANPQNVDEAEAAYNTLKAESFPPPLPFHKPLETLRRLFDQNGVPLHRAMEALRKDDAVERPNPAGYGWRDILMERLKLSRDEYRLLTDRTLTVQQLYGLAAAADPLVELVKAKPFTRRVGITYEELAEILGTQFLRRLGPVVLFDTSGSPVLFTFDSVEFRCAKLDGSTGPLLKIHYVALLRFLRLRKKLGLSIARTDQLIAALYPAAMQQPGGSEAVDLERLDAGFLALLPRIGVAFQAMERLKLTPERGLPDLLACWSPLTPGGTNASRAWLAGVLGVSVVELQALLRYTRLDPFAAPDPPNLQMIQFLDFMTTFAASGLKPAQALYLIWNEDLSGKSVPEDRLFTDLASALRAAFAAIDGELALADDPAGKIARKREQAVVTASAALRIDPAFVQAMLTDPKVLQAAADAAKPALDDLLAPELTAATLRGTTIRLLKVWSLASALKMTAPEVVHFATRIEYQIGGKGWLNALADSGRPSDTTWKPLKDALVAVLSFARLKAELSPDDERLFSVLQKPNATLPDGQPLLLSLTRWGDSATQDALLGRFGLAVANLTRVESFQRVYDAGLLAKKLNVPVAAVVNAMTNEPTKDTVQAFQAALRSSYGEAGWRAFIRTITDELRGLQRDALVAFILRKMAESTATRHIDTADKLFEYFLMDVEMEPCMQTTRVRHALSAAQLFIERCLMNLEKSVPPSLISSRQWEWMKRYRLWEANRKVFLWPENWLEPELRDDQSPFFKESMSELLQGDVTDESAATALLDYLSKLDEIAKLEPCDI
ncbi:MAG: neuraminidase-like domain-containing protein, partial [Thermoanaerobaculia bacterium]